MHKNKKDLILARVIELGWLVIWGIRISKLRHEPTDSLFTTDLTFLAMMIIWFVLIAAVHLLWSALLMWARRWGGTGRE